MLQEVVATPRPTCDPVLPTCTISGRSPTMISGPGTRVPAGLAPWLNGGTTTDLRLPFTTCVISIGCIAAPTEIVPIIEPASEERPSALANCFEIRSRPPAMPSDRALAL